MTLPFQIKDLHATQDGYPVLRGVNLEIGHGEQLALLGPSGAGKTSLLRVLSGVIVPSTGSCQSLGVQLNSASEKDLRELRSRIGFVHQDLALVPTLRVLQNVLAGRLGRHGLFAAMRALLWPSQQQKLDALSLLDELGVGDKLFERTHSLSGGEQQRVALARALYQEPKALLADEPIASVDPTRARSLLDLMGRVASDRELPLIVSLHQADIASEFFPRLVGLRDGQVEFDLPSSQVSSKMLDDLYEMERFGPPTTDTIEAERVKPADPAELPPTHEPL